MAASSLLVDRIVYAFNWYNVGAVLPLIGSSLHAGTATLGIVIGAFLVGVGIFQIPAGFAALRFGSRRVSLVGLTVMGTAGVLSAFSPSWQALAIARFFAGVGAAFFFSPGLSLISSYYPPGQRGPLIGLYNGGFSLGGAVGLAAGAYLGVIGGWPLALGAGGVGLLLVTAASAVVLPRIPEAEGRRSPREILAAGRGVLTSRSIWALSLALTGFWGAIYIVAQYFVQYAHDAHGDWGVATAAALAAVVVVASFPGGPVGGWLAEQGRERRRLIGVFGALAGLLVLSVPFVPLLGLWAVVLLLGFVDGVVFAILYLIPSYLPETQGEGLALGVALVNSIQVLLGSGLAIAFGFIVTWWGYEAGWIYAGATSLVLLPLLWLVRSNRGGEWVAPATVPAQVPNPRPP